MEALLKKQKKARTALTNFEDNFRKANKDRLKKIGYISGRLEGLEPLWSEIRELHGKISEIATEKEESSLPYFTTNEYSQSEEVYFDLRGDLLEISRTLCAEHNGKSATLNESDPIKANNPCNEIKLPQIYIPKFSGSYNLWTSFHDLFVSLIHNNQSLTTVQKLHYLKANLTGEAEQLLRHFSITSDNYKPAWETLRERYENKRMLVNAQLKILFNQASVQTETAQAIKKLLDTTNECLHCLKNLEMKVEYWDAIVIFHTVQKLPPDTHQLWEQSLSNTADSKIFPSYKQLQTFLENRFRTLEVVSSTKGKHVPIETRSRYLTKGKESTHSFHTYSNVCLLCRQEHLLRQCPQFLKMEPTKRQEVVRSHSLCLNCLAQSHSTQKCHSRHKCFQCHKPHHTLLHVFSNTTSKRSQTGSQPPQFHNFKEQNQKNHVAPSPIEASTSDTLSYHTLGDSSYKCVLLATALIKIRDNTGSVHILRALLDQGSQASFITEAAAQRLQMKKSKIVSSIHGLCKKDPIKAHAVIHTKLYSNANTSFELPIDLLVLRSLTDMLPPRSIPNGSWEHLQNISLADPEYMKPGRIDVLLGADIYAKILLTGVRKGPTDSPIGQETELGWIVSGPVNVHCLTDSPSIRLISLHSRADIDIVLRRFWEVEEISAPRKLTPEEKKCEDIFAATHQRDRRGRYLVKLPFRHPSGHPERLGRSRDLAIRRLMSLEKHLKRNDVLRQEYHKCIKEYLDLNHMEPVFTSETTHANYSANTKTIFYTSCYLPHHAVIKESSSTTKVRVVFDASSKTTTGVSLNQELLVGPTIQQELMQLLIRWRTYKIAFTADITKMYRQIKVHEDKDADYQRIVWRWNEDEPIQDFKLNTVTFGTASAPYLATKVIQQLATDEARNYPAACEIARRDLYVDDLMSGADTIQEALSLQGQIIHLMQSGGFELHKWASNRTEFLEKIPNKDREIALPLKIEYESSIKALGVHWHPAEDSFIFKVSLQEIKGPLTKRILLSDIARLFDPLGWISPTIVKAKILMQQLWLTGLAWDDEVPMKLKEEWFSYRTHLKQLEQLKIPRWIKSNRKGLTNHELHGFCDASERAYAAAVYLKSSSSTETTTTLIVSKTRVAPIKQITLPRLELCGAVLLARLMKKVQESLELHIKENHAWTDSTITLAWIRGHPSRWKSFVANRVSEIQEILTPQTWHHVPTEDNPADIASRGIDPESLLNNKLWWHGPAWLKRNSYFWPNLSKMVEVSTTEECKPIKTFLVQYSNDTEHIFNKYSSLSKLIKVIAYCLRFYKNAYRPTNKPDNLHIKTVGQLTPSELRSALITCLKMAQDQTFHEDISNLKNGKTIHRKSKLLSLNPFLDSQDVLRVGGRLNESQLTYNQKHPIILSNHSHLSKLIIDQIHLSTLHGGVQLMLAVLRRKYWILNAKMILRQHTHKCLKCFKYKAQFASQIMGNLPQPRVTPTRPFTHVGVDYAGPIDVKISKGRGRTTYKGYICIFVCLATKAIHIEAVSDLTTSAFLACFRRFTGRRGVPMHIYSDCGTNFVGASKQLVTEGNLSSQLPSPSINENIEWHFNPPGAPHFGGLWEAGVKSIKTHLKKTIGDQVLTFEELTTILCQIEACLNSRPLCPISNDPSDLEIITPGHFLMGTSPLNPPEPEIPETMHPATRWRLLQQLYQSFWRKWSSEYLHQLQQRRKWRTEQANLEEGQIVLLKDERTPPGKWPLGRIAKIHPGKDNLTRVATVRTRNSLIKRPITKICLLPIEDNVQNNNNTERMTLNLT